MICIFGKLINTKNVSAKLEKFFSKLFPIFLLITIFIHFLFHDGLFLTFHTRIMNVNCAIRLNQSIRGNELDSIWLL